MTNQLEKNLLNYKKNTITIDGLTKLTDHLDSYEAFARKITTLEEAGVLIAVKATGRNQRTPSLAYRYKIYKHALKRAHHKTLHTYRQYFHNAINLDAYFYLDSVIWQEDLPYLEKINQYINENGFPTKKEPAPGRSFELVSDEKWIEQGGSEVLYRTKLYEKMRIFPVSDPLMMAFNPKECNVQEQIHLIVENKTTYQALVPVLQETPYATLIYGSGNKITKSMENFSNQYPMQAKHTFYYFGDLDRSGVQIWHILAQRWENIVPAISFYQACLRKEKAYGKTNQPWNERALTAFIHYFTKDEQQNIYTLLLEGAYYPQEALQTEVLQKIFQEYPQMEAT